MVVLKSLERGLRVLELLSEAKTPFRLTDIAGELGDSVSTVHHVVANLKARNFLRQDPQTREYMLGLAAFRLGMAAQRQLDIRRLALPFMRSLADITEETVTLSARDGVHVLFLEQIEAPRSVKMTVSVGDRAPLHSSASGKVLLTSCESGVVNHLVLNGLTRFTPHTIVTEQQLRQELERIRERGYALDMEERELGLRCVAAPIYSHDGQIVASVSVSGPVTRLDEEALYACIEPTVTTAKHISAELGATVDISERGP